MDTGSHVKRDKLLPPKIWREIHAVMPIPCVDVVILDGVTCKNVMLVKRSIEPLKGEWFFPGGRVWRGEKIFSAAKRIARTEVGAKITPLFATAIEETLFNTDPFGHGRGTHTINTVVCAIYVSCVPVRYTKVGALKIPRRYDSNHSDVDWFKWGDSLTKMHPYVIRNIRRAMEGIELPGVDQ